MSISEIAIKRPVFTTMITLGWVVLGLLGFSRLGTDLYPDVKFPFVTIAVPYPGAAPEDVERQVVKPLEDAVIAVNGVDRVEGFARDNVGVIAVVFKLDTDFETAAADVRDKVNAARGLLPEGVKDPIISKADIGASPILVYAASAPRPSEEVRRLTEDRIKPALERIPGVAKVDVLGGREREIQLDLDPVKLESFGLSPLAVAQKLRAENATIPAGHYASGDAEVNVRTVGEFRSVAEVREAVLFAGADGKRVRAGDLGEVVDGFAEQRTLIRANGTDAVAFQIVKTSDANTVTVAHAVKAELAKVAPRLPKDFQTALLIDQSTFIEENAHEVEIAIVFGGAMAILIILFFMMDLRSTFISALALPTSVIGTFLMMYVMGFTLNMMTLLALSLAIGLLIDDAVVVRENIFRHLEMGEEPEVAAARGTSEIALAVFATTMTIVAVFVPVAFMDGIVGQFFRQFGLTVTAAVLLSMMVAFTLDPMLSARLAKKIVPGHVEKPGVVRARLTKFFEAIDAAYRRALVWTVGHPKTIVAGAIASFVAAIGIGNLLGSEFLTPEDRGQFIMNLEFPPETSLAETSTRSLAVEKALLADPRFRTVYATVGPQAEINKAKYRVNVLDKNERIETLEELKTIARTVAHETSAKGARSATERGTMAPGVKVTAENPPMIEGLGAWSPIMVSISGPSYEVLAPTAEKVAAALREVRGAADVMIDYTPGKEELQVLPDRGRAGAAGVPIAVIGMNVRVALDGDVAGKLRGNDTDDEETDVRVRLAPAYRNDPVRLAQLPLPASQGTIRLGDVAAIEPGVGPSVIHRQDRSRTIVISATTAGRPMGNVVAEFRPQVAALVPEGYEVTWLGNVKDMEESNAAFGMALGVAILFIYIVLASQFESFVHPATIMLSLPLAMVGAMGGLWIYGAAISMGAQIGIILLMGLVTKNAILLVDQALVLRREGMSAKDAMLAAGPKRLRPILMTSAAMVLGMLPTALSTGSGSEFRAPMAVAVIGGVISSTILTLLVVPVVFLGVESMRARAAAFVASAARLRAAVPGFAAGALLLAVVAAAMMLFIPATAGAAESANATTLTLEKAMQLADESNPDLAVAAERVSQSQSDVRSAYAGFLPHVIAQGSHLIYDEPLILDLPVIPGVTDGPITLQEKIVTQGQIQATWPLLNVQAFPTLAAARHGEKATAAAYAQGRQELFYGVAQAFWAVAVTDRLVVAGDEAVANAAELVRVANEQVKAEVATNLALLRARTAEEQAKQVRLSARGSRGAAEAALRRLTGVEGAIVVDVPAATTPSIPDDAALWKTAQEKRADLLSAREAVAARASLKRAAQLSYLPVIAGQGTYYQTTNEGLGGKSTGYNGGLVASWTIFDGGLREAKISKLRSQEREAIAAGESTLRKAREEVSRASLDLATALAARDAARETGGLAKEAQALAQVSYRAGTATNLEVTQANATLLQAQAGLAQAEAQAALAELALRKVTGQPLR